MRRIIAVLTPALILAGCLNQPGPGPLAVPRQAGTLPAEYADAGLPSDVSFRGATRLSGRHLSLTTKDFAFAPTVIETTPGRTVELTIHNSSDSVHTFTSEELGVDVHVAPGDNTQVSLRLPHEGPVRFSCAFHAGAGMVGAFVLTEPPPEPPLSPTITDAGPAAALAQAAGVAAEETGVPLAEPLAQTGNVGGTDASGAVLRADLAELLSEHTYLAAMTVQQRVAGPPPGFRDARTALRHNTTELADRVGAVRGVSKSKRDTFHRLWRAHIDAMLTYADAVAAGSEQAARRPLERLASVQHRLGLLAEDLTHGAIGDEQFAEGLHAHTAALRRAIDAVAGDRPAVNAVRTAAIASVERVAVPLAEALGRSRDLPGVDSKAGVLREKLAVGFSDHVFLVGLATQWSSSDAGRADAQSARAAVRKHAAALAKALGSADAVSQDQAATFEERWQAHASALLDADADPREPLDDAAAVLAKAVQAATTAEHVADWFDAYADAVTTALDRLKPTFPHHRAPSPPNAPSVTVRARAS